jgi:hypothetical protein
MANGMIDNLTIEPGPAGKKVVSFQLVDGGRNVCAESAKAVAPVAALAALPESISYDPKEWCGIGENSPVKMRLVGDGSDAKLQFMFNSPYTDASLSEHAAMSMLPSILSPVLKEGEGVKLAAQIDGAQMSRDAGGIKSARSVV